MNILLTGSTGYIGTHLLSKMIEKGMNVTVILKDRIEIEKINHLKKKIKIIFLDLKKLNVLKMKQKLNNIDCLVHLAWQGSYGKGRNSNETQLENLFILKNLIELCKEINCKKFVSFGSVAETESFFKLQLGNEIPTLYALAKFYGHGYSKLLCDSYKIDWIWISITNVYGKCLNDQRIINQVIINSLLNKPMQFGACTHLYDFIYIDDAINSILAIIQKGLSQKKYVLGSGNPKPLKHYLEYVINKINQDVTRVYDNQSQSMFIERRFYDNKSVFLDTGYKNKISFKQGIDQEISRIKERLFSNV